MHALAQYFAYKARKSWPTLLALLIIPVAIPYLVYGIILLFANTIDSIDVEPFEAPALPPLDRIAYTDDNFVYFSYAPADDVYE
jgi:hypothetical protein